ncbi:hypothetical protein AB7M46_005785 [Bradyrhizobium elkanii]
MESTPVLFEKYVSDYDGRLAISDARARNFRFDLFDFFAAYLIEANSSRHPETPLRTALQCCLVSIQILRELNEADC